MTGVRYGGSNRGGLRGRSFQAAEQDKASEVKKMEILIIAEQEKDIDNVFGILKEDIDIKKLRKEMDRHVPG